MGFLHRIFGNDGVLMKDELEIQKRLLEHEQIIDYVEGKGPEPVFFQSQPILTKMALLRRFDIFLAVERASVTSLKWVLEEEE